MHLLIAEDRLSYCLEKGLLANRVHYCSHKEIVMRAVAMADSSKFVICSNPKFALAGTVWIRY